MNFDFTPRRRGRPPARGRGPSPFPPSKVPTPDALPLRWAAVSLVRRGSLILTVWNKRYGGWSLPGGMVEPGETNSEAQARELREETGCGPVRAYCAWQGMHGVRPLEGQERTGRASAVAVYACEINGEPREVEEGCPVRWMTREEFLVGSPFAPFYERIFREVPDLSESEPDVDACDLFGAVGGEGSPCLT